MKGLYATRAGKGRQRVGRAPRDWYEQRSSGRKVFGPLPALGCTPPASWVRSFCPWDVPVPRRYPSSPWCTPITPVCTSPPLGCLPDPTRHDPRAASQSTATAGRPSGPIAHRPSSRARRPGHLSPSARRSGPALGFRPPAGILTKGSSGPPFSSLVSDPQGPEGAPPSPPPTVTVPPCLRSPSPWKRPPRPRPILPPASPELSLAPFRRRGRLVSGTSNGPRARRAHTSPSAPRSPADVRRVVGSTSGLRWTVGVCDSGPRGDGDPTGASDGDPTPKGPTQKSRPRVQGREGHREGRQTCTPGRLGRTPATPTVFHHLVSADVTPEFSCTPTPHPVLVSPPDADETLKGRHAGTLQWSGETPSPKGVDILPSYPS